MKMYEVVLNGNQEKEWNRESMTLVKKRQTNMYNDSPPIDSSRQVPVQGSTSLPRKQIPVKAPFRLLFHIGASAKVRLLF